MCFNFSFLFHKTAMILCRYCEIACVIFHCQLQLLRTISIVFWGARVFTSTYFANSSCIRWYTDDMHHGLSFGCGRYFCAIQIVFLSASVCVLKVRHTIFFSSLFRQTVKISLQPLLNIFILLDKWTAQMICLSFTVNLVTIDWNMSNTNRS